MLHSVCLTLQQRQHSAAAAFHQEQLVASWRTSTLLLLPVLGRGAHKHAQQRPCMPHRSQPVGQGMHQNTSRQVYDGEVVTRACKTQSKQWDSGARDEDNLTFASLCVA